MRAASASLLWPSTRLELTEVVARSSPFKAQRLTRLVFCVAVAGFGKKRGPNSNPTS